MDPSNIADFKLMVMDYQETFKYDEWKSSREMADEMVRTIPSLQREFRLDQITLGDGACFYTAAIQQLRRPEVNERLTEDGKRPAAHVIGLQGVRGELGGSEYPLRVSKMEE